MYSPSKWFFISQGASMVHFQDGNAENLKCITAPNVLAYLMEAQVRKSQQPESSLPLTPSRQTLDPKVNFYARDWGESPGVLSAVKNDGHEVDRGDHDYDIILLTRIPYSAASMKKLYAFIKKVCFFILGCLCTMTVLYVLTYFDLICHCPDCISFA
jgi:hypothetical protein